MSFYTTSTVKLPSNSLNGGKNYTPRLKHLKSLRFKDIDIHGTQLVYHDQTSSFERFFWAFIIMVGVGVCVAMCCITVVGFAQSPTTSTISRVSNKSIPMPDVAICSSYPWNLPKMIENNFSMDVIYDLIDYYPVAEPDPSVFPEHRHSSNQSEREQEIRNSLPSSNINSLFLEYGLRCENSLLYCNFGSFNFDCCNNVSQHNEGNSSKYANSPSNSTSSADGDAKPPPNCMAHPYLHPKLGTCLVMREIPDQKRMHQRAGLTMLLRMDPDLHVMDQYSFGYPYEAFLLEFSLDYYFSTNVVTLASLQMLTNVQLSATKTLRQAKAMFKEPCDDKIYRGSRSDSCSAFCKSEAMTQYCGCEEHGYLETNGGIRLCNPIEVVTCPEKYRVEIRTARNACETENCSRKLCEEWSYHVSTSVARLTNDVFDLLPKNTSVKLEELAMISIRHDSLTYQKEEETPISTPVNLISFLGGQIGLWLGGSIITVVQLMIFAVKRSMKLCYRTYRSSINHVEAQHEPKSESDPIKSIC